MRKIVLGLFMALDGVVQAPHTWQEHFDERSEYEEKLEALRLDYAARLKALGISEQDVEAFHAY